jgi:hypothetical protein
MPVTASSGNQANATAVATIPAIPSKTAYLSSWSATASGSTTALTVLLTISGLVGGVITLPNTFPAGVTTAATPIVVPYTFAVAAVGPGTAITLQLPAGGLGNTNAAVNMTGFYL